MIVFRKQKNINNLSVETELPNLHMQNLTKCILIFQVNAVQLEDFFLKHPHVADAGVVEEAGREGDLVPHIHLVLKQHNEDELPQHEDYKEVQETKVFIKGALHFNINLGSKVSHRPS